MKTAAILLVLLSPWANAQTTRVFVELSGPAAFSQLEKDRSGFIAHSLAAAQQQLAANLREQEAFAQVLQQAGVAYQQLYRTQRLLNGLALALSPAELSRLKAFPQVRAIHPIVPKKPTLSTTLPLIGALDAWGGAGNGYTGAGVRVGIIDTGIDYRHRTFGDSGVFPSLKVAGGWDFAGDSYDASSDVSSKRNPNPDADPLDCNGHGTHVASIVGGYGVHSPGNTFPGPWGQATSLEDFLVPPGVAPEVELYALKVFGCSGSTALVTAALEWAADPNGDGNPGDHLDIVNLSLGSAYGSNDDADALAANRATQVGILVVAAAGNDGDTTFITSSPATATTAVSVASSVDSGAKVGAFEVVSPQDLAGRYAASEADFGPDLAGGDVEALLAAPATGEELGCNPFSPTSQQALSGKIALINRGTCTFKRKVLNAQNAGAVGVLIVRQDDGDPFTMGNDTSITTTITIPAQMTVLSVGNLLRQQLTNGVLVRLTARYRSRFTYVNEQREDTVSNFSSRGPRQDLALKPDVAAPGETIFAAAQGSTTSGVSLSGTSMATPVVVGAAAILKQAHPDFTPQQLKALIMNSATPFLFGISKGNEPYHQVSRVGAGRLNLAQALATPLLMWAEEQPEAVSLSFGSLRPPAQLEKAVRLRNITDSPLDLRLSAKLSQPRGGIRLSILPAHLVLGPGEEQRVTVILESWQNVPFTRDATQAPKQGDKPRFYLSELSGHIEAQEGEEVVGHLPFYAVLLPGGNLRAQPAWVPQSSQVVLSIVGEPQPFLSPLVVPLQLTYEGLPTSSPRVGRLLQAGLALAGGGEPTLVFGVATEASWLSPEEVSVRVFFDTNKDGVADFRLENALLEDNSDVFGVRLCPLPSGSCSDLGPLGGLSPEGPHVPAFLTRLMVLPLPLSALGVTSGSLRYWFETKDSLGIATQTPKMDVNLSSPPVRFAELSGPGPLAIAPGQALHLQTTGSEPLKVLMLFPYNREPLTTQVVPLGSGQRARKHLPKGTS